MSWPPGAPPPGMPYGAPPPHMGMPPRGYGMPPPGYAPPAYGAPPMAPGLLPPGMPPGMPPRGMPPPGMPPPGMPPLARGVAPPIPARGLPPPIPASGMPPAPGVLTAPPRMLPPNLPALSVLDGPQEPVAAYVGKLPDGLEDGIVQRMLRACGAINKWKRAADPNTGNYKRFGHVEFAHPTGALMALKHLDGLELEGSAIVVKVPSKAKARLDEYKKALAERRAKATADAPAAGPDGAAAAPPGVGDNAGAGAGDGAQDSGAGAAPVDEAAEEDKAVRAALDLALETLTVSRQAQEDQARIEAELDAADRATIGEESSGRGGDVSDPNRGKRIMTEIEKFRLQEKQREEEVARKKKEDEVKLLAASRALLNAKREAEQAAEQAAESEARRHDGDRRRRSSRSRSRSRSRGRRHRHRHKHKHRRRHSSSESDGGRHRHSRSRKHRRDRSRSRDRKDRDRGRHRSRRHRSKSRSGSASRSPHRRRSESKPDANGADGTTAAAAPAAAPAPAPAPAPAGPVRMSFKKKAAPARSSLAKPVAAAFAADDDEAVGERKRELILLDYTEEERLSVLPQAAVGAAQQAAALAAQIAAQAAQAAASTPSVQDRIAALPKDAKALFAHPIDWAAVDRHNIVDTQMKPVVAASIEEYLGEVEPTIMEFLLGKLRAHAPASALVSELEAVLDDDAVTFVADLWRKLATAAIKAT